MCAICGCSHEHEHHHHPHVEDHAHDHGHDHPHVVPLEAQVLAKNNRFAERNRGWLEARGILAVNLLSSPGAGKTTLLERSLAALATARPVCAIEGDQATELDAERLRASGCPALQINTGTGCHLDAEAVGRALRELAPPPGAAVMIENVGNLVCPALFDLGERAKVVILSVTEGEDKPLKYPHMFRAAQLMLVNKIDLLPHVRFDLARCLGYARRVNPQIECLTVSALTGEGLAQWHAWLGAQAQDLFQVAELAK